jgi:hypothetical protein
MKEYQPKKRTALVLTGSGTAGAYHAGVLKALDESGVKIDLVVGSGVGTLAAAFGAVAGGPKLYGRGGFWDGVGWGSFYRVRPGLFVGAVLLGVSFLVFLLPAFLAVLAGFLFPLALLADAVSPGAASRFFVWPAPEVLREAYLASLSAPVFLLSVLAFFSLARLFLKDRRRISESFESVLDSERGRERLCRRLWEIARGHTLSAAPPSETELGKRYVSLAAENLGQPGFRELILRTADLEAGGPLCFALLQETPRAAFETWRNRPSGDGAQGVVNLRTPDYDVLFFDAVLTGLLPPWAAGVRRVLFPKGGPYGGEVHRLADASLVGGCGLSEALAAGAEQVIVVSATPETPRLPPRRRGPRSLGDALVSALERQAVESEVRTAERINRMVETLGHRTEGGGKAWQDPVTGRIYRDFALYCVRPERRSLGPLELDGALDPSSEVKESLFDFIEQGYKDAYRLFVEPVVGASPEPRRGAAVETEEGQPVEL